MTRRWQGALVVAASAAALLAVPAPAGACSRTGTVPGQPATVTAVSAGGETLYVDDRGAFDPDHDDEYEAEGIWIYRESNGRPGLQRGGDHVAQPLIPNPLIPPIRPIVLLPPDDSRPVLKKGLTLFPHGFGGGTLGYPEDPCVRPGDRPGDTVIF